MHHTLNILLESYDTSFLLRGVPQERDGQGMEESRWGGVGVGRGHAVVPEGRQWSRPTQSRPPAPTLDAVIEPYRDSEKFIHSVCRTRACVHFARPP